MYPRLLHVYGPLWIQSYGLTIVLGLAVFLLMTYKHPLRQRFVEGEQYLNVVFMGLFAGIIGGRILYVLTEWRSFVGAWYEIFFPWTGGFAILGAILGVLCVTPLYLKSIKVPALPLLDLTAVFGPLMQGIGRFGCFLAGCCYGKPALQAAWYTVTFTDACGYLPNNLIGIPLYATQLYACIASLLIFCFMYFIASRCFKKAGQLVGVYLILENSARFIVDFWRSDQTTMYTIPGFSGLILSDMQLLALALGCVGLVFFALASRYSKTNY